MTENISILGNLPVEIRELQSFLTWKLTFKQGQKKPAKIPFYVNGRARAGDQGSAADVEQLVGFAEAVAAARTNDRSGIGLAMLASNGIVALDFDNCVQDRQIINERVAELCWGTYTEYSPSGTGLRALFKGALPSRKDTKSTDFAVEVFYESGYVTMTGDVTDECKMFGFDGTVSEVTPEVRAMYVERFGEPVTRSEVTLVDDDEAYMLGLNPTQGWTLAQGEAYLMDCDPGCGRDEWVKAGMALHFEFAGSAEALDLYNRWSAKGANYGGRADVDGRWRSFGKPGRSSTITGTWLVKWAKTFEAKKTFNAMASWKAQIQATGDEYQLRHVLCPKIVADPLMSTMEREGLAQVIMATLKKMGTKYPIDMCRKMLSENVTQDLPAVYNASRALHYDDSHCPDWLKGWVYVTADDMFFKINGSEQISMQAFNAKYNRYMTRNQDGMVTVSAHTMALEHYKIPVVHRCLYMPKCATLFKDGSLLNVNRYNANSVPEADKNLTENGKKAISLFKRHLAIFCNHREREQLMLTSWLAHNVQKPGEKIRWSILLKGVEGDGKSLIGDLMRFVMGRDNVKSVSPTVLNTDFNGWAQGSCLAIIEELRIIGHSRYDTANRLKPLITNDTVEIHQKGKDPFEVWNTQNYISFTNYMDALPLTDNDRRYMIIFSPFTTKEELIEGLKPYGGTESYFTELHDALHAEFRAIRQFLLTYPISPEFNPNGRAPMSAEKHQMIEMGVTDEQRLVRDCIFAGGAGIAKNVVVSSYLRNAAILADSELVINNIEFNKIMDKLGWVKYPSRVFWQGKTEIVWSYGNLGDWAKNLRPILDETLPLSSVYF